MKKLLSAAFILSLLATPLVASASGLGVVAKTPITSGQFIVVLEGGTGSVDWAGKVDEPDVCAKTNQTAPCVILYGVFNGINILPNGQSGAGTPGQEGIVFGPNQVKSQ